jgi:hypothetical protein
MRCASGQTVVAPSPDPNGAPTEDILASAARLDGNALGREFLTFEINSHTASVPPTICIYLLTTD